MKITNIYWVSNREYQNNILAKFKKAISKVLGIVIARPHSKKFATNTLILFMISGFVAFFIFNRWVLIANKSAAYKIPSMIGTKQSITF